MAEQIALIEAPIYETTGAEAPRVLHEMLRFEILGAPCLVRTSPDGDTLFLRIGRRDFAVSLLDLAATAALAVEGHLKGEIRARVLGRRPPLPGYDGTSKPNERAARDAALGLREVPLRGVVEADGFITLHPRRDA